MRSLVFFIFLSFSVSLWSQNIIPVKIDPDSNGFQLGEAVFKYESTSEKIIVGNLQLSTSSFRAAIISGKDLKVVIRIPDFPLIDHSVTVNNGSRNTLASFRVDSMEKVGLLTPEDRENAGLLGFNDNDFVIRGIRRFYDPNNKNGLRFCVLQEAQTHYMQYCTPFYDLKPLQGTFAMLPWRTISPNTVIMGVRAPNEGEIKIGDTKKFTAYIVNRTGFSFDMNSLPQKTSITAALLLANQKMKISGLNKYMPIGKTSVNTKENEDDTFWESFWANTIFDQRVYWSMTVPAKNFVDIPGFRNVGIFQQLIDLSKVPRPTDRALVFSKYSGKTYVDEKLIRARKQSNAEVSSEENFAGDTYNDGKFFVWKAKTEEKGAINKPTLKIQNSERSYLGHYEIYRAYAREFSLRLSGIISTSGMSVLGEAAFNQWFENFLWIDSEFTNLRWGVGLKYFNSLLPFKLTRSDGSTENLTLTSATLDLKYRLTPGLWERDESWGLIAGYQTLTYFGANLSNVGAGVFWARSLPKFFDDIFNWFWFMKYPKWVDAEFIYYPTSLTAGYSLGPTYSMNFHGKILWKKNLFGEAGFGIKSFDFSGRNGDSAQLTSGYGTLGMGINF